MASEAPMVPLEGDGAALDQLLTSRNDYSELFSIVPTTATDCQGLEKTAYQCNYCGNCYGRVDHARRHCQSRELISRPHPLASVAYLQRSDVEGKAFRCSQCSRSFNRK